MKLTVKKPYMLEVKIPVLGDTNTEHYVLTVFATQSTDGRSVYGERHFLGGKSRTTLEECSCYNAAHKRVLKTIRDIFSS